MALDGSCDGFVRMWIRGGYLGCIQTVHNNGCVSLEGRVFMIQRVYTRVT